MTAIKSVFIRCDSCGVPSTNDAVPTEQTVAEALKAARQLGFRRDKLGRDRCADCYVRPGAPLN